VVAIGFNIQQIIEDVYRTGYDSEQPKTSQRAQEIVQMKKFSIEKESREDKNILCPLPRTQGFYD
jgi:hypothetical protein